MTFAKLSLAQAASINLAREHADDSTRKLVKKEIFGAVKQAFGIPATDRVKCETTDAASDDYLVIKNSSTGVPYPANTDVTVRVYVQVPMKWFRLDAGSAREAILECLEQQDEAPEAFDFAPDGAATEYTSLAYAENGDAYVLMPADHFDYGN